MFTIKHAAEQVGVSVSTLRAWERRYGVGSPRRTESGYRMYDDAAVRALRRMQALISQGWSVRSAATEVLKESDPSASVDPVTPERTIADPSSLLRAAAEFDPAALSAALDHGFSTASFETVVDAWLLPALHEIGLGWESGEVSVAGEHLVAGAVARRLAAAYEGAGTNPSGPRVVIGLPPGARHDLGLLSFATAARRAGLSTTWLGADVPVQDWVTAIELRDADCAVLAVPTQSDVTGSTAVAHAITRSRPDVLVAVGGACQERAPEGCLRLGHRVGPAASRLAERLRARGPRSVEPAEDDERLPHRASL